jgi:hypothetical protein
MRFFGIFLGPNENLVGLWALFEIFLYSFLSISARILVIENFRIGCAYAETGSVSQ